VTPLRPFPPVYEKTLIITDNTGNTQMAEPKKYNTVVIYNLRVVDLEPRTKIDDVGKPRVILTLLENEIECTPNQDMRTAIILKHADKIKEYDPGGKGHIIIDYTKTWTIPQE
jgi:hypothetical protein